MIKDIRIMPRGAGKTKWCESLRKAIPGAIMYNYYADNISLMYRLRGLPRNGTVTVIVDEVFSLSSNDLEHLVVALPYFDFYLAGTPMKPMHTYPKQLVSLIKQKFPEVFI